MSLDFVFFHVGDDFTYPKMLCESIKKTNPNANIIQLTDKKTPILSEYVNRFVRVDGKKENLMFLRSKAYQAYEIEKPTLFLDTDMLVVKKIEEDDIFKDKDLVLCEREFQRDLVGDGLNNYLLQNNLSEYINQTLYEIFPILGCFIAARESKLLKVAHKIYANYANDKKRWNGDQFALKEIFHNNKEDIDLISENKIAYPILRDDNWEDTFIIHFKGKRLKNQIKPFFEKIFLDIQT